MKKLSVRDLTLAAAVGAIYVVLGYFANIFNLTVQSLYSLLILMIRTTTKIVFLQHPAR